MRAAGTTQPTSAAAVIAAGVAILAAVIVTAALWFHEHPFPLFWDEAAYANQAIDDHDAFVQHGLIGAIKALLFNDPVRPPAYRALALPFNLFTAPTLARLRGIATLATLVTFVLLVIAVRRVASVSAALLATAMVFSSPDLFLYGSWFGTEYPLYLATALLLLALLEERPRPIVLTFAVALGLLSKFTFVLLGGPAILVTIFVLRRERASALRVLLAAAAGATIALGWWAWHLGPTMAFVQLARGGSRWAWANVTSVEHLIARSDHLLLRSLGAGTVLALAVVAVPLFRAMRSDRVVLRAILIGGSVFLPLLLATFLSPVFGGRIYAPAFLGLTAILALGLDRVATGVRLLVAVAVLIQTLWIATHRPATLPRIEQTDWRRLASVLPAHSTKIAFLGGWPSMSPPEICYGWRSVGRPCDAQWLWRLEEGPINWEQVLRTARDSDAVLVVPPGARHSVPSVLAVDENADNAHNAELVRRLASDPSFDAPVAFPIGRDEPVNLLLYRRKQR